MLCKSCFLLWHTPPYFPVHCLCCSCFMTYDQKCVSCARVLIGQLLGLIFLRWDKEESYLPWVFLCCRHPYFTLFFLLFHKYATHTHTHTRTHKHTHKIYGKGCWFWTVDSSLVYRWTGGLYVCWRRRSAYRSNWQTAHLQHFLLHLSAWENVWCCLCFIPYFSQYWQCVMAEFQDWIKKFYFLQQYRSICLNILSFFFLCFVAHTCSGQEGFSVIYITKILTFQPRFMLFPENHMKWICWTFSKASREE